MPITADAALGGEAILGADAIVGADPYVESDPVVGADAILGADALRIANGEPSAAEIAKLQPGTHLVFLHLDGSEHQLPEPGDAIFADGKSVGQVTSAAWHYELGPIALAVVSDALPLAEPLVVLADAGGCETRVAASQTAIAELADTP